MINSVPAQVCNPGKVQDIVMSDQAKPQILIVEDDSDLRTILRLQLGESGFEVIEAADGSEGFSMLQAQQVDCVLLDLMMPVMDGFSFLKRVRSIDSLQDVPIMILTASEDERHRAKGFQYQADAYMNKPYDLDELTEKVRELCSNQPLKQSSF